MTSLLPLLLLLGPLSTAQGPSPGAKPELSLPWVFADHMVLQRDEPILVWGRAEAGAEVRVRFASHDRTTAADQHGRWRLRLPAEPARADGRSLRVSAGDQERIFEDVLVGEVWLCAGQSNMDFPLSRAEGGAEAASGFESRSLLRFCDRTGSPGGGARRLSAEELDRIAVGGFQSGSWRTASPTSAASFSAVGAYFGMELAEQLQVPVGLIDVSVGGSSTEGWVPLASLRAAPELEPLASDFLDTQLSHPFLHERTRTQLGDWIEAGSPAPRPRHFFEPGYLFETAIQPLAPFPLRGVLWYQGESNAHLPRVADQLFRLLVAEWRESWGRPELPFHFVQLPGMGRPSWPEFREVQASWLDDRDLGMAVAIDCGHPTDVHPRAKRPVGERLARLALKRQYGLELEASGPIPAQKRRHGAQLEIEFEHAEGLAWAEGRGPTGFELAGEDRRYYPARAELRGSSVWLSSPEVPAPVDARYAWAPVPEWGLVNRAGLPAAPFRSQDWVPVRVACIGDSITAGHGLAAPETEAYPARLQELLGDGYQVRNFGRSGAGVALATKRGDWPRAYRRNPEHERALLFQPELVISNLGINDIMAWGQSGDDFVADYGALLADYRELPTEPELMLWGPLAPLFPGQRFHGSRDEAAIHRAIAKVARKNRAARVDLHQPLRDHPELFPDHLHPDANGAERIAERVHAALVEERMVKPAPRTIRMYVLTGQSNALGTTADPGEAETAPPPHPADAALRFSWSNRSTRAGDGPATLIGDSGGRFLALQAQQGEGRNTSFWGPEIGFARALFEAGERDFVVVKAARGGGGNGYWAKGSADDHMYRHVVRTVEQAVAALPAGTGFEVAALLYLQGESDSAAEARAAGKRLSALARNLRRELPQAKSMRVLVGGIAADGGHRDRVRVSQEEAAAADPLMTYFSNLDLQGQLYDGLHFDRQAKLELGRRFAQAWQDLGGPSATD